MTEQTLDDRQKVAYERIAQHLEKGQRPNATARKAWRIAYEEMERQHIPLYFESICNRAARLLRECIANDRPLP